MHKKNPVITYYFNNLKNAKDSYSGFVYESASSLTHCHKDFYEIILITKGEWIHRTNQENIVLPLGTLLFLKPGTIHSFFSESPQYVHLVFGIEKAYFENYVSRIFPNFDLDSVADFITKPIHAEKRRYLEHLAKMVHENPISRQVIADEALYACIADFMYVSKIPNKNIYVTDIIQQLNDYTYLNMSVKDICKRYPLSQPILLKLFRKTTGMTIVQYKTQRKLDYACTLLKYSNVSISDIAQHLQYDSLSYFVRLFKKTYGVTPTEYRRQHTSSPE